MKNQFILYGVLVIAILLSVIYFMNNKINDITEDRNKYLSNTIVLLDNITEYKTKDSANAVSIGVLELTLSEYKKYRADDLDKINNLYIKNRKLENVINSQTKTISKLSGPVNDSIIYRDNYIADTLKCIDIKSKWYDFKGCIDGNRFNGYHINRDSLDIVVTVKYKRFLGFLWYTNKIQNRKVDIQFRNPDTKIMGFEYFEIKK